MSCWVPLEKEDEGEGEGGRSRDREGRANEAGYKQVKEQIHFQIETVCARLLMQVCTCLNTVSRVCSLLLQFQTYTQCLGTLMSRMYTTDL